MPEKLSGRFIQSSAVLFMVTAIAKISALRNGAFGEADPLFFFLARRDVLILAAAVEMAVATFLFWPNQGIQRKLTAVCWVSSLFLAYRLGLWSIDFKGDCGCLGGGNIIGDWVSGAILGYLILGGTGLVACNWITARSFQNQRESCQTNLL